MDYLLIFFYILLSALVLAPFLYVRLAKPGDDLELETERRELVNRREVLLENLKDLKIEFDTGKLTDPEFKSISSGIVHELEEQDQEIKAWSERKTVDINRQPVASNLVPAQKYCHQCGFKIELVGAKFCPECGTRLMV
ncbi:zinc-ribbon domain protein [Leptospira fainei serovar Hurstbridge str. BUT 6]|uniref:Zinc-ribbon domain protein n=1 Tax=Leptospira fainei serovar Hurstbridge str. BUT 6 TaxID=1193011 RepID=S3UXM1_9LEPT|nr:zinc ribbon domain-containing protein [Leptospira fainei]EPG73084.1 zinc-ribbon domain protein [Leptospira fainei serovar Hurstbridge str. BUT 6]